MKRTKTIRKAIATAVVGLLTIGLALNFSGCSKETTMGPTVEEDQTEMSMAKKSGDWVKKGSKKFRYNSALGYYKGGNIKIPGTQTMFNFEDGSLTPPPGTEHGATVKITMKMKYNSARNKLVFSFSPHGCQFSPNARVKLDYAALGIDVAPFFYIEDDKTWTEQAAEQVNVNKRFMMIKIDHFSRYALAHSE
jgi:hypothetical protein